MRAAPTYSHQIPVSWREPTVNGFEAGVPNGYITGMKKPEPMTAPREYAADVRTAVARLSSPDQLAQMSRDLLQTGLWNLASGRRFSASKRCPGGLVTRELVSSPPWPRAPFARVCSCNSRGNVFKFKQREWRHFITGPEGNRSCVGMR